MSLQQQQVRSRQTKTPVAIFVQKAVWFVALPGVTAIFGTDWQSPQPLCLPCAAFLNDLLRIADFDCTRRQSKSRKFTKSQISCHHFLGGFCCCCFCGKASCLLLMQLNCWFFYCCCCSQRSTIQHIKKLNIIQVTTVIWDTPLHMYIYTYILTFVLMETWDVIHLAHEKIAKKVVFCSLLLTRCL